jgi:two-component system response regulator AtoC
MQAVIFVADDEPAIRSALVKRLTRLRHTVRAFDSGEALIEALETELPDLVLLDLRMPGLGGMETLKVLRQKSPQSPVIILTAYGTVQDAVEATKLGAYDFLIKTVELEAVDPVISRVLEYLALRRRVSFDAELEADPYGLSHVIAHSVAMQRLLANASEVARNARATVLLQGETGTGKEFLARVIHHNGSRRTGPFVGVNCTAIPRDLFESELFGYERGAFTGATQRKHGLLEKAEEGTLFLDEIGDLDLSMQAKLLRVLQEHTFRRVGGTEDLRGDFRLIAATNRDLKEEVVRGRFREDLYFRLNVVLFELPPLRQRVEDILALCEQALIRFGRECGKEVLEIDAGAKELLLRYRYPGNVRELHNIIERALIFCQGKTLTADLLPLELRERAKPVTVVTARSEEPVLRVELPMGKLSLAELEAAVIEEVVRLSGHNKSLAAKRLGLTRFALDRRLKKLEDD